MSTITDMKTRTTYDGGSGPEDPMLERIEKLETKSDRIEDILLRLEPKIIELCLTSAKQSDLTAVRLEVGELKSSSVRQSDLIPLRADISEMKGRLSMLPTWWMLMTTVLATWAMGAGIVYALVKFGK